MSVTLVTTCYANYGRFLDRWAESVWSLNSTPDRVIVATDRPFVPSASLIADLVVARCTWKHPQAFYQDQAIRLVDTDWVWLLDVDDFAMPDALAGLSDVDADVWQLGFLRSDGERYIPPTLTNDEYLALDHNPYVGTSMIRTETYHAVGGFRDVALQDWDLWRRLASLVDEYTETPWPRFQASDRAHFHYMMHPSRRGEVELTMDARPAHLAEMMGRPVAVS